MRPSASLLRASTKLLIFCALLPFVACECEDEREGPWSLSEERPEQEQPDLGLTDQETDLPVEPDQAPDLPPDLPDLPPDLPPDMPDLPPDMPDMRPDMTVIAPEPLPTGPWLPEVIEEVSQTQALTDRSSVSVADDGKVWVGYHTCTDLNCNDPWLTVTHDTAPNTWRKENIARQWGTFGVDVWRNRPYTAYLDHRNNRFAVAERSGSGANPWRIQALDVQYTGEFDGLDLTHDSTRLFVTFANRRGDPVALFAKNMVSNSPWARLRSLDVGRASAALERGLNADDRGNLFLVHRDGEFGPYGVARFRIGDNIWDRQRYFPNATLTVSSMVARPNGDICMISMGSSNNRLVLTCGTMSRLDRDVYQLNDTSTSYSSLIEGLDGSLIVAYNAGNNGALKVWRLYPDGHIETRTVFAGPSYGVSTALDRQNRLVITYYTCRSQRCTLELIRQPYQ